MSEYDIETTIGEYDVDVTLPSYQVDVTVTSGSGAASISISDDGTEVLGLANGINFSDNLDVTDNGDGTVTVTGAAGSAVAVSDSGTQTVAAASELDFKTGIDVTDDTNNVAGISINEGEINTSGLNNDAGFITDYTVTELDVTQHEGALTLTESQISDLDHYTNADLPISTTAQQGIIELATNAEAITGTDTTRAVTPSRLQAFVDDRGFISDYTVTQADVTQHEGALTITESQISDLAHVTNNNQLTNGAGYITDYTVTELDVTQHEAALTLTEAQISDLSHFSGNYNDLTNKPDLSALNEISVHADEASLPATGEADTVYIAEDTGYMYRWNGTAYTQLTDQTAIWGQITGTLSNQTDLQNALDGKADTGHTHTLTDITDSGALAALNTVGSAQIDTNAVGISELDLANIDTGDFTNNAGFITDYTVTSADVTQHEGDIDHGSIAGLGDDDHTQYSLADGTRDYTGIVSYDAHPTFAADTDIVDKKYVDDSIVAAGSGDVSKVGTPVDNQIGVWTGDGTIEGDANFTWDGADLAVNTNDLFVDGSTGNVGIGTTNPGAKLEVDGNLLINNTSGDAVLDFSTSSGNQRNFRIYNNGSNLYNKLVTETGASFFWQDSTGTNVVTFKSSGYIENMGTLTVKGTGDSSIAGNVGIGTTSPGEKLDVVGNAEINGNIIVTGTVDGRDVATDGTKLDGIEALADVTDATNVAAAGAVMDTGDETIAGVKTFSSSPIVPAPTTDLQAATKKYVDDSITAGGGYTDEQAQDAVGTILGSEFTYDDATPSIVLATGGIDETKLDTSVNASLDLADSALQSTDIDTLAELNAIVGDATLVDTSHTHTESDITDLGDYITASSTDTLTNKSGSNSQWTNDEGYVTTDTQLTNEEVQDIAGPLVATGGTKTLITVTYDDANNDMDFVVDDDLSLYDNTTSGFITDYTVTSGDVTAHEGDIDHDQLTNFLASEHFTQANITTTGTVTTGTWSSDLAAGTVDAIGEIASGLKTGSDTTLVTGTSGTDQNLMEWDSNGDAIDSGIATDDVMGTVVHGSTAGTARPSGFTVVTWIGSVEPSNATNDDVWIDTT